MPLFEPGSDTAVLRDLLQHTERDLVVCFCAAWCDTCTCYRPELDHLSTQLLQYIFVWIDIEDHPELLEEEEIENFPTLLIQRADRTVFYGPMLPHINHLKRLLAALQADSPIVATRLPNLRHFLMAPGRPPP
jgi:thiol-disulfide isomerase/thioredoxin